jgi:phosphoglycerate dehydrogenase-like enzyme
MAPRILMTPPNPDIAAIARDMAPAGFELIVAAAGTAEFRAALGEAEYLVGVGNPPMDDAFHASAPRLRLVQLLSAGYDTIDIPAARRAGVPVANNGGANSTAVAEHTLMLMLAVCRRLVWQHTNVAAGRWRANEPAPRLYELEGMTLGIVGLGTIGKKVARMARAFGMAVQYHDIVRLPEDAADALGVRFRLLAEVLRSSDIVSLHVPLSDATRGMIGAAELGLMKPSAYLINTCRGPVVDEAALHEALVAGRIAGAGLDVFEAEPPPADNPLLGLPNVVLTAHLAGPTYDNKFKQVRNAFDNIERVARGQAPLWVIPELRAG